METEEVIEKLQIMIDHDGLCEEDKITCRKAIELLDREPAWAVNSKGEKVAFKNISAERAAMLLEMMEHEPCEDAISRKEVIDSYENNEVNDIIDVMGMDAIT